MGLKEDLKACGGSFCKNDKRAVVSFKAEPPKGTVFLPEAMSIIMKQELEVGVPVQILLEITPQSYELAKTISPSGYLIGNHAYNCTVDSVKARLKPSTAQFIGAEEKNLNHIIYGTEDVAEENKRIVKCIKKQVEKADEANRFTGLEI